MASKSGGTATTAPKGRATTRRNAASGRRRFLTPTMEWILAILVIAVILAVVIWIGRDWNSTGGGGHSGAPSDIVVVDPLGAGI